MNRKKSHSTPKGRLLPKLDIDPDDETRIATTAENGEDGPYYLAL